MAGSQAVPPTVAQKTEEALQVIAPTLMSMGTIQPYKIQLNLVTQSRYGLRPAGAGNSKPPSNLPKRPAQDQEKQKAKRKQKSLKC